MGAACEVDLGLFDGSERLVGIDAEVPRFHKRISDRFSALAECYVDQFCDEGIAGIGVEWFFSIADTDDTGVNFGPGHKTRGGDFMDDINFGAEMAGESEFAVVVRSDFCDHAKSDFFLNHDDHALEVEGVIPEVKEYGRGDVVGEVGDEFELLRLWEEFFDQFFRGMIKDVAAEKRYVVDGLKLVFQTGHERAINFDSQDTVRPLVQARGEGSEPGANFDHIVLIRQGGGIGHDPVDVVIKEQVLAEGLLELYSVLI